MNTNKLNVDEARKYVKPEIELIEIQNESLLCASGDGTGDNVTNVPGVW